jgi:hypothetical protein
MEHHNNVPDDYPMPEVDVEQTCFVCSVLTLCGPVASLLAFGF